MVKIFQFVFIILFLYLQIVFPATAAENFLTDYRVTYAVSEDGTTHAVINGTLTNATSDYYVSAYKVQLGFENMVNLQASDDGGKIEPIVSETDTGQMIELKFNKKVVGFGNKHAFRIAFDTPDITHRQGKIWEINIPGIGEQEAFNSFDVTLQVPDSFGTPSYIKPADYCHPELDSGSKEIPDQAMPDGRQVRNDKECEKKLVFTKEQLGKSGISLAFGDRQMYSFDLSYHLYNENLFPIRTEIALPPSTNYQEVFIESIDPQPMQVKKDTDGNWLAEYQLMPSRNIDVRVKGKAEIFLYPKKQPVNKKDLAVYLEEKPYWQLSHAEIKRLGRELGTPKAIYDFVVKTLSYDFSRITSSKGRLGAVGVLENPESAVCLEFTDLFVALARAAGIPAREVNGYAYTQNPKQRPLSLVQDILHAWPEYYDTEKQTWVMIDPTWGNTTGGVDYFDVLDFDHFTFVKKGVDSAYPIPAGGYKSDADEFKKDVLITFADSVGYRDSQLELVPLFSNSAIAGLPIAGKIQVINKGPSVVRNQRVSILSSTLLPKEQISPIDELLPFARRDITFQFQKQPFLTNSSHDVTMIVAGKEYKRTIDVMPFFVREWKLLGGIFFVVLTVFILIITIKARRVRVPRQTQ